CHYTFQNHAYTLPYLENDNFLPGLNDEFLELLLRFPLADEQLPLFESARLLSLGKQAQVAHQNIVPNDPSPAYLQMNYRQVQGVHFPKREYLTLLLFVKLSDMYFWFDKINPLLLSLVEQPKKEPLKMLSHGAHAAISH